MLQRYSHDKQGDVCLRNPNKDDYMPPGPGLKEWKCPKGCKKVKGPPFCEDKENKGDACRVPLPGGGPSEETSGNSSLPLL